MEKGKYDILINSVFNNVPIISTIKTDMDRIANVFQKLLLTGKIREAVNYVTNQAGIKTIFFYFLLILIVKRD